MAGERKNMSHKWTDEDRIILRRDYRHTRASAAEIAQRLSLLTGEEIAVTAVRGQVDFLGLGIPRKRWTPAEREKLAELITKYSPSTIAEKMGRAIGAVRNEAARLGLTRKVRDGWYNVSDITEIFGVDKNWVYNRINAGTLIAEAHNAPPSKRGSGYWCIQEADLRAFIVHYANELKGRNVDLLQIVEILGAQ